MHTFDEADFKTLFGFSHESYGGYSGICSRIRESVNITSQKIATRKQSNKNTKFKASFISTVPKKKLSCRDQLSFQNKSFKEDIIDIQRLNRIKEIHKENKLLSNKSRGAIAVQRKISNLSQRRLSINMSIKSESDEEEINENTKPVVFAEEIVLPVNTMFRDLDELTEMNHREENHFRVLLKKHKRVYDSLSDEEASDEEINEVYYVEPFSNLRFGYDLLLFVLVFYSMFSVPYQLAFYFMQSGLEGFEFTLNLIIDVVFIFDIILSFFTAYYDFDEKLVKYYYLMALHYMQTWFIVDFLSGIPMNSILHLIIIKYPNSDYAISTRTFYQGNLTVMYNSLKLLRLIKAMKVFSMNAFIDKLTSSVKQTVFVAKTIRLITTLLIFSMLMHLFACLVIFFGYNSYPNWIVSLNLEPNDSKNIYIASLYFICTTVISVGYGDILTYNITERLINGFLLIVGLLLYTWTLSSLTSYLISDDKIIVEYRTKCNMLDDIKVCYDNMSLELYSKIQRHLLYKFNSQKMDVNEIFNSLPIGLRNNLIIEMYKPIVKNFVFFKNFNNTDFIIQVVLSFKPLLSLKGEKLLNDGDVLNEMIFVKKGKLILEFPLPMVINEAAANANGGGGQDNKNVNINNATTNAGGIGVAPTLGEKTTLYECCGNKHTYAFQTMASIKGNLPWLKKTDSKHYELSDFDLKKQFNKKKEIIEYNNKDNNNSNNNKDKYPQQYVKLIEIRKNEHFGDVLMFLTKRSPLRVRVKTKTAELYLLKKTDAVEISNSFPKIWKQIIKKSLFNMKQINRLINKSLKFFFIHYEGNKNILAKTILPYNPSQTFKGSVVHDTFISNKNKLGMLAKLTIGKPLDKTQIQQQVEAEIDTSNSELQSIPENDSNDSSNISSDKDKDKDVPKQVSKKMKITKILETFEEDVLKQSIRKIQQQTIIFQHYDELLKLKEEKSSEDELTPIQENRKVRFTGSKIYNTKITVNNNNTLRKSSSSSSGSSIAMYDTNTHNNNNNNQKKDSDSSFSSSYDDNRSNVTNSNIMNKSKSTLNRSNINKSEIMSSHKSTLLTYKDMKFKQPPTNLLDELVEKNSSHYSVKHDNSSHLLDDDDDNSETNEGNVYSEFHSNEDDLKNNLFMPRPLSNGYDPFTYCYKNFNYYNNNDDDNDNNYEKLLQNFNKLSHYKSNSTNTHMVYDTHNNNNNNNSSNTLISSLINITTIQSQKPKANFGNTLSSKSVILTKTDTEIKSNKLTADTSTKLSKLTVETIPKVSNKLNIESSNNGPKIPNKPNCNFTFSRYTSNNNATTNANGLQQIKSLISSNNNNINAKDKYSIGEDNSSSSSSSSSVDTSKKSLQKLLKSSNSITPNKAVQLAPRKLSQLNKKETFTKGSTNHTSLMTLKTLAQKNDAPDDTSNNNNNNNNIQSILPQENKEKEKEKESIFPIKNKMPKIRTKKSRSNLNLISFKGIEDVASNFKKPPSSSIILNNQSDSSSNKEKGEEDLEVEKIMGMTPHLAPDKKRGNLFKQILTPATFSRKLELDFNINDNNNNYKKSFFGLSPALKKRSILKQGNNNKGNALEIIATNIQENSTNLNEPKEFYSHLFSQFLGEKKDKDETIKEKNNNVKKVLFEEPMKIKEENEELEQTIIYANPNLKENHNSTSNIIKNNHHNDNGVLRELKRHKTLLI